LYCSIVKHYDIYRMTNLNNERSRVLGKLSIRYIEYTEIF